MIDHSPVAVYDSALAERLGLPSAQEAELWLVWREGCLVLSGDPGRFGQPLVVDFTAGRVAHRRRFGGGRGQLIARACGFTQGMTPAVVDATAGLGRDAFVLASLGARVLMMERVPAIFALLENGLARARADADTAEIATRMQVVRGDAAQDLEARVAEAGFPPQVIHLDPMFPHREKSALVKKEMRLFRTLAGDDVDAPHLLEAALDVATHRVVVKRPRKAPSIEGPSPRHVVEGKTSRYDIYVHRSISRCDG